MKLVIFIFLFAFLAAVCTAQSRPWITSKTRKLNGMFKDWQTTQTMNVHRLTTAEAKGRLDYVLYGDSITSYHYGYNISRRQPGSIAVWNKYFSDLNAIPMAIPGDQIGQVLWRLQNGKEKPKEDPKVVGILIGLNDILRPGEDTTHPRVPSTQDRMDALLTWIKTNMPTSAVLLCGLTLIDMESKYPWTPHVMNQTILTERTTINTAYKSLANSFAQRGMRIKYVECTASITNLDGTPLGTGYVADPVHLTFKGHDVELKTMKAAVDSLI
jgi:lysophospholipase L1-like esterase